MHPNRRFSRGKANPWLAVAIAMTIALSAPFASAGSASNPDATDRRNDARSDITGIANSNGRLDILGVWVESVSDDEVAFGIKVRDFFAASDSGAFRDSTNMQVWMVQFTSGDLDFSVEMYQHVNGGEYGAVRVLDQGGNARGGFGQSDTVPNCPEDPVPTLTFDASAETIVLTTQREFTIQNKAACGDTPSIQDTPVNLADGEAIIGLRAEANECEEGVLDIDENLGETISCNGVHIVDKTTPLSSFNIGASGSSHLAIRPARDIMALQPGATGKLTVLATNPSPLAIIQSVSMAASDGWAISPATRSLNLPSGVTKEVTFDVTAPAEGGERGTATLSGGATSSEILLLVGEYSPEVIGPTDPILGSSKPIENTYFLYGSTQPPNSPAISPPNGDAPTKSANLVSVEPFASETTTVTRTFDGSGDGSILPFGVWRGAPVPGHVTLQGAGLLSIPVERQTGDNLDVMALVGPRLPTNWDGVTALEGVGVLQASSNQFSPSGTLKLGGSLDGVKLAPGQALEVALFAVHDGDALSFTLFDPANPASLNFDYAVPIVGGNFVFAGPTTNVVTIATGSPLPGDEFGANSLLTATGAPEMTADSGLGDLVYRGGESDVVQTNQVTIDTSSGGSQIITLSPNGEAMNLRLLPTDGTASNAGTVWMQVYGITAQGTQEFLGADRRDGLSKSLRLVPVGSSLTEYQSLQVVLTGQAGAGGRTLELTSTTPSELRLAGAITPQRGVWQDWTPGESGAGTAKIVSDGTTAAELAMENTPGGPTFAPIARFTSSVIAAHVGTPITFIDNSFDPEGNLSAWSWDLGDGAASTLSNPTHRYGAPGTYVVNLVVTDNLGVESIAGLLTLTIVALGEELPTHGLPPSPGNAVPPFGTMGYYRGAYASGTPHAEDYSLAWAQAELEGSIGQNYLALSGGRTSYAFGSVPESGLDATMTNGVLSTTNNVGATITTDGLSIGQAIGNMTVNAVAPTELIVDGDAVELVTAEQIFADDDASDGLLSVNHVSELGGIEAVRSLTILEGTTHSDVRSSFTGVGTETLSVATSTILSAAPGSWVAVPSGSSVQVSPVAGMDGKSTNVRGTNSWVSVFDPVTNEVTGAVFSGNVTNLQYGWADDALTIVAQYEGVGNIMAAQYLTAYSVGNTDATRYAGVQQIANQDANEIGIAYLTSDKATGVGWAGAGARVEPAGPPGIDILGMFVGAPAEWIVEVEAEAEQSGKALRAIIPGSYAEDDDILVFFDDLEEPLELGTSFNDGDSYIVTVGIPEFSVHSLRMQSSEPAVSPFVPWVGLVAAIAVVSIASIVVRRKAK